MAQQNQTRHHPLQEAPHTLCVGLLQRRSERKPIPDRTSPPKAIPTPNYAIRHRSLSRSPNTTGYEPEESRTPSHKHSSPIPYKTQSQYSRYTTTRITPHSSLITLATTTTTGQTYPNPPQLQTSTSNSKDGTQQHRTTTPQSLPFNTKHP
jgi:hypothetical protein